MAAALVLVVVAVAIGWRRPRIDGLGVSALVLAMAAMLAYTYKSLGG